MKEKWWLLWAVCQPNNYAELDAYYTRLYCLTRDELRYILGPKEVHGEDFPGKTFRVLKEKEVRLYGELSALLPSVLDRAFNREL